MKNSNWVEETSHKTSALIQDSIESSEGKRRQWNRAPEHLRPILDTFTEVWEDVFGRIVLKGDRGKFLRQAEELYTDFGDCSDFIIDAGRRHKKSNLTLNGPASIRWAIREEIERTVSKEETEEHRRSFWDKPSEAEA